MIVAGNTGDITFTSMLLPAHTLQPGTAYVASLIYDNEAFTNNAGFNGASSIIDFATTTDLAFTTAPVPEPASLVLCGVGGLGLIAYRHRRTGKIARWKAKRPPAASVAME
jgi:hypothetical protein